MPKGHTYHNNYGRKYDNQFNDHQHEIMMKDKYKHNQGRMTPADSRELKTKTFPYLNNDDVCLTDNDKQSIKDFYYSMRECLLMHDNSSVQNKLYVSLKPVNLKPFYIKPYLTHESEIKFAEAEMEKLRQMGILHRGSSEFLSAIVLIKKSHSGAKLAKSPEYRLVVDFKYLKSHLPDIKFSYPEIKHVLHKIGRHSSHVFSMLDLKHTFPSINLTEESKQYTSCCASPGSPTYQFNKLSQASMCQRPASLH